MARTPLDPDEALAAPFYLFALLLVALPLVDFVQNVGSFQPTSVQWRFATVGLFSGYLLTPLIGIVVAITVAAIRGHGVAQRVIAVLNLVAALVLLALMAGFVLDSLQLRASVPETRRAEFGIASVRAIVKYLATVVLLVALALRAFRIPVAHRETRAGRARVPLVNS